MDRRNFLRHGVGAVSGVAAAALTGTAPVFAADGFAHPGPSPYGDLAGRRADRNGIVLPEGFRSRVIAIGGETVSGTDYRWHPFSDGGATIPDDNGGWYLVSNSEVFEPVGGGGASSIHFDASGKITGASPILKETTGNCAGGATSWGTWLSCEEVATGRVWECDPRGAAPSRSVDALGIFRHEAVTVAPEYTSVFMTEDEPDGLLYRFVPHRWPDLSAGRLLALRVDGHRAQWIDVPDPTAATMPTRAQVPEATVFEGGEGICYRSGFVYFTTKYDNRVHVLDVQREHYAVVWDGTEPLYVVDNIAIDPVAGQLFVAEEGGNMEIVIIDNQGNVAPFLRVEGHPDSEIAGVAFSPDETRLYFSSQRGPTGKKLGDLFPEIQDDRPMGIVFEVEGPFKQVQAARVVERTKGGGDGGESPAPYFAAGGSLVVAGVVAALAVRGRRSHPSH